MSLNQEFNKVATLLSECHSFPSVRKRAREEFANKFLDSSKDLQETYIDTLYKWATNKMHSTNPTDKVIALAAFAYILDIVEDQTHYQNLATQLERILPVENITVIEGITFVLERISRRSETPILPTLLERLTSRLFSTSVLSSVFIFKNVIFTNNSLYQRFGGHINHVVLSAVKHTDVRIRDCGVELFLGKLKKDPSPDECALTMIDDCLIALDSQIPHFMCDGYTHMIAQIMIARPAATKTKIQSVVKVYQSQLRPDNAVEMGLRFIPVDILRPYFPDIRGKLISVLCGGQCQLTNDLAKLCSDILLIDDESVEPISNFAKQFPDQLFFITAPSLAKKCPNMGQYIFERIAKSKFSPNSIKAGAALAQEQQHFSFKISNFYIDYINNHFNDNLDITFQVLNSIHFLHTLKWTEIAQQMIKLFNTLSNETKQIMIPSFYQVLKQIPNPTNLFINFLFIVSSDPKARIRRLGLELIPDDFLVLFNDQAVFTILESFYDDENKNVSLSALNIIGRINEKCSLTTVGFFSSRIASQIPQLKSISSLSSRRKQMEILPTLIHLSGDVIDGYIDDYVNYFLEILNTPLQPMTNLYEATVKKDYRNDDRIIRKNVLFCLNELTSKIKFFNTEKVHQLVTSITNQLFVSTHRSLHIEVGNTLLLIFRSCDFQHSANPFDIIKMHNVIFNFLANCQDSGVIDVFLRLFGTIGPLDPYLFHTQEDFASNETFDWFPICDVSKRQTCYLHFVMRFVLGQLINHSNIYDPPVLIIAIVYIFQSDPTNSLLFLGQIVHVFSNILTEKLMNPPDAIFHFLRSIIMLVDVSILPFAVTIMNMIMPFLNPTPNLLAVKTLASLVYALKGNYKFDPSVFSDICSMLRPMKLSQECDNYLMLTITLMVIFCESNPYTFFDLVQDRIKKGNQQAMTFLTWVINCGKFPSLLLPAIKLASSIKGPLENSAKQLMTLCHYKDPELCDSIGIQIEEVPLGDFNPKPDIVPNKSRPASQKRGIATVLSHASSTDYSPTWLLQLTQDLVLCSSSAAIRACRPLLNVASKFHIELFPLALVSVWEDSPDNEREQLSNFFLSIVNNPSTSLQVLSVIVDAAEALDRAGFTMFNDPMVAGIVSEKCKSWFKAIRFFTKISDQSEEPLKHLLKVETQLKRVSSANGLLQVISEKQTDAGLFESLNMWQKALEIYETHKDREISIPGKMKCYLMMDQFDKIMESANEFDSFTKETKNKVALSFFLAALNTGKDYSKYEPFLVPDDPLICTYRSIAALRKGDLAQAEEFIERGMNTVDSQFAPFNSYEPALPLINYVMVFEDIRNVINVKNGKDTAEHVLTIWEHNMDSVKTDSAQLRRSMNARELLDCSPEQRKRMNVGYLNDMRRLKEWAFFDNIFKSAFNQTKDPRANLLHAVVRYDRGITTSLNELNNLVYRLQQDQDNVDVYCDAVCAMASRSSVTEYIMSLLSDVLRKKPNMIRAWRIWTYANLNLTQRPENVPQFYANNAMNGFWKLVELSSASMHFLCQLCSLFFNYGTDLDNFAESAEKFKNISAECVSQIIPQLVVQLEHPVPEIRQVVHDIIQKFSQNHFQAVALPLNLQRQNKPSNFIDSLFMEHIHVGNDVTLFAISMTNLAITPVEEVTILLEKFMKIHDDSQISPQSLEIIKKVLSIIEVPTYKSFLQQWFSQKPARLFIEKAMRIINPNDAKIQSNRVFLYNSASALLNFLSKSFDSVVSFDIDELGLPITIDNLSISVPGIYQINKPLVTVKHIFRILKMIPSQKRPRKIRMFGSDGNTYKYLLKGKEDLRLDQHIMQFFSLVNSILTMNKLTEGSHARIMQYHVIPLTTQSGLISWAANGETLSSLIRFRRKLKNIDEPEKKVFGKFCDKKDALIPLTKLQKLELFRDLVKVAPSNEIDEALWLKSSGSQQWLIQTTNFNRSTALMSMVGYVIGLGDRHPMNILFMKRNGNIVHIDLSDVFEKAALRRLVAETVPFRLTRMIERALGAGGTHGIFTATAEDVMSVMRRNSQTILAFLDIFVQEPVIDALWYEVGDGDKNADKNSENKTGLKQAISRVAEKLAGSCGGTVLSVHDQVEYLIKEATSEENLAQMFHGWAAYW